MFTGRVYCFFLQQLTEALLTMEEDKAISLSKERASIEAIGQKEKLYTAEIALISEKLLEVTDSIRCVISFYNSLLYIMAI